jgi:deazaflavin-dependent oxidoreductase (nitroreductase family)
MASQRRSAAMPPTYKKPGFLTSRVFNPLLSGLVKLGMSPRGASILLTQGRKSGEWRSTPVNPLTIDGVRYLVAPRGDTHWSRNLRAAGGNGKLRLGRKERDFHAVELPDAQKPPILREYLKHWRSETGKFFGVSPDPTDEELAAIARNHPVFRIQSGM